MVRKRKKIKEIKLLDTVVLTKEIAGVNLSAGMTGTVVDCLSQKAVLVEFIDRDSDEVATYCLSVDDLALDMAYSDMAYTDEIASVLPKLAPEMASAV